MNDPQPEGHITLHEAYEVFQEVRGIDDPDRRRQEFLEAFLAGELEAKVWMPGTGRCVVPRALWDQGGFPDRIFLADDIQALNDENPWRVYRDRTAFVERSFFDDWLSRQTKDEESHEVLAEPIWTYDMAVAWVWKRDAAFVRYRWSDYRRRRGLGTFRAKSR